MKNAPTAKKATSSQSTSTVGTPSATKQTQKGKLTSMDFSKTYNEFFSGGSKQLSNSTTKSEYIPGVPKASLLDQAIQSGTAFGDLLNTGMQAGTAAKDLWNTGFQTSDMVKALLGGKRSQKDLKFGGEPLDNLEVLRKKKTNPATRRKSTPNPVNDANLGSNNNDIPANTSGAVVVAKKRGRAKTVGAKPNKKPSNDPGWSGGGSSGNSTPSSKEPSPTFSQPGDSRVVVPSGTRSRPTAAATRRLTGRATSGPLNMIASSKSSRMLQNRADAKALYDKRKK